MKNAFNSAKYLFVYTRRTCVPSIPKDSPTYIDLTFCLEGEMNYVYNGERIKLSAGDAILFPVGSERERYFTDKPNNYASFNLLLKEPFVPEVSGYIPGCVSQDVIYMLDTFKRVCESVSARKPEKQAAIFSYLYHTVVESVKDNENPHVKGAKQYMLSHLADGISLDDIAAEVHLVPNYLCALFKDSTGKTVMQYLAEQRIDLAKRLIITSSEELYKISESCGFSDYNHFSHTFKRLAGVTPAAYRKVKKGKYLLT